MVDEVGFYQHGVAATAALAETWTSTAEIGRSLGPTEWDLPTPCPGWSVQDQFSHLIGVERSLLGEAAPVWDVPLGDHVKNAFGAALEPWVAVRRSLDPAAVLAEFVEVTGLRLSALTALTEEEWAKVGPSPSGDSPYADFMDLRVFDSWVHQQDVRTATVRPGGSGGRASAISLARVERAMGFVVGKKAAAPEGSMVRFSITGPPGDARQITLGVRGGRAKPVGDDKEPTVTLTLSSVDFVQLGCGRTTAAEVGAAGGIGVSGDSVLADAVLNCMNFMI
jgi:uncharacterized protein (TIGR03083 family)